MLLRMKIDKVVARLETENRLLMQARVEERADAEKIWMNARDRTRIELSKLLDEALRVPQPLEEILEEGE